MIISGLLSMPAPFVKKVVVAPNGCWIWQACTDKGGYGRFHPPGVPRGNGYTVKAHRYAYECLRGPIPDGQFLTHDYCQTPACVNPNHLAVSTLSGIARRRESAGNNWQTSKTRCPHGHDYIGDNIIRMANGGRRCRTCERLREQRRQAIYIGKPRRPIDP